MSADARFDVAGETLGPSDQRDSRLVIVEPNFRGHRMYYSRLLATAWPHGVPCVTLSTSSESLLSDEFRLRFPDGATHPAVTDMGGLSDKTGPKYHVKLVGFILAARRRHGVGRVVVPEGDKLAVWLSMALIKNLNGITVLVMRAPDFRSARGGALLKNIAKSIAMRVITARGGDVFVLSPATRTANTYYFKGWSAAPDPVGIASDESSIRSYRNEWELDGDRVWVGVFGNISRRKNLDVVVKALIAAGPKQYGLLVAGKIASSELDICQPVLDRFLSDGGIVRLDNRLLDDRELDSAIACVEVAVLAHSSEGPSGILGKAVALGTFVVAAGALSLRDDVDRLGGGVWTSLNPASLAEAVKLRNESKGSASNSLANGSEFARVLLGLS